PFSSTNAVVKEALEKLSTIGAGNVAVTGSGSTSPIKRTVEFIGTLAKTNVPEMTVDGAALVCSEQLPNVVDDAT
ncbi:MAG: hypothetical protein ACRDK7_07705, partial [Solirubrobacteraceae bacterium]